MIDNKSINGKTFIKNKKGVGPIVVISLLLLIVIAAFVVFSGWYNGFINNSISDSESKEHESKGKTYIQDIYGGEIYFMNNYRNITISEITVGNDSCSAYSNDKLGKGYYGINVSDCIAGKNGTPSEVKFVTDKGVFTKNLVIP